VPMSEGGAPFVVRSTDGVELAGLVSGEGPPLLLVYGAMMEQTAWGRLLPHLQPGRAIYTYDRRGRGNSTDGAAYEVGLEVDDLLAVAATIPGPLDVFAHSSGALLALHASERGLPVRRLVLYEPPLVSGRRPRLPADLPQRIAERASSGDHDGALDLFMREGLELSADEVERLREGPRWQEQLRYARTAAYDLTISSTYALDGERLAQFTVPVLLIRGDRSPDWMRKGVEALARLLPHASVVMLPGQGHNAQFSEPKLLADAIEGFLG
jgi:pimeloyl-ACP methyl ester carboxylesterase